MTRALVASTVVGAVGGAAVGSWLGIRACQWTTYYTLRYMKLRKTEKAPSSLSRE